MNTEKYSTLLLVLWRQKTWNNGKRVLTIDIEPGTHLMRLLNVWPHIHIKGACKISYHIIGLCNFN